MDAGLERGCLYTWHWQAHGPFTSSTLSDPHSCKDDVFLIVDNEQNQAQEPGQVTLSLPFSPVSHMTDENKP